MHESGRAQRRLSRIAKVTKPGRAFSQRHRIGGRQFHPQIMWVLPVYQRLTFVGFAGLEKQWRASGRKGERLKAEHAAKLECARTDFAKGHRHEPVRRLDFRHAPRATLSVDSSNCVEMKHEQPLARYLVPHVRRG